jgi:hypothetical protein
MTFGAAKDGLVWIFDALLKRVLLFDLCRQSVEIVKSRHLESRVRVLEGSFPAQEDVTNASEKVRAERLG